MSTLIKLKVLLIFLGLVLSINGIVTFQDDKLFWKETFAMGFLIVGVGLLLYGVLTKQILKYGTQPLVIIFTFGVIVSFLRSVSLWVSGSEEIDHFISPILVAVFAYKIIKDLKLLVEHHNDSAE